MFLKVVYIVSTLKASGPINILYNLIKYIDRKEFEPIIVTLSPEPNGSMKSEFESLGIEVKTLNLSRAGGILKGPQQLKQLMVKIDPDIIHTHGHRADIYSALFLNRYRNISTAHNYPFEDYVMKYGKVIGNVLSVANIYAFKRMDLSVGCSNTISSLLKKHKVNSISIQNGVDTENFYPITEIEKRKLRKKLNIPENKKLLVSIGSLIYRKNPEMIINAFKKSKIQKDAILIFLGDGKLREACEAAKGSNSNIKILGHVNNVNEYLKAADYFVTASRSEGLPNTVLEALATGVPIIVSNIMQHLEILQYNNDSGYDFDIHNEKSLVDVLNRISETENKLQVKSCLDIIGHLNAENMTKKYEKIYKQVVYK